MDLTFASRREGKWLLSNSMSLVISMGVTANVIRPVEIYKVVHFEVGSRPGSDKYREATISSVSDHFMLSGDYSFQIWEIMEKCILHGFRGSIRVNHSYEQL